ncbi:MAG: NAD(P)/FAD-dependent oxidoreductase [Deltaproteobacteria bacterium]
MSPPDVIVLGAGAAGLLCALEAGKRGRRVLVLEKANAIGKKIRISGGGRCNFTNLHTGPENFLSGNPHFCRSALARFTPRDFIARVDAAGIEWHEKKLGQLFCTQPGGAGLIVEMLRRQCAATGRVTLACKSDITKIDKAGDGFVVVANGKSFRCRSLVVATGGPSIPKMGATGFGYALARQFGLPVVEPRAALVPLVLAGRAQAQAKRLAGVSLPVIARCGEGYFDEDMLFTHRGLSGPAILQISSYWSPHQTISIDLLPGISVEKFLSAARRESPKRGLLRLLEARMPARLAVEIAEELACAGKIAELSASAVRALSQRIHHWTFSPAGSEGYRTAEVTRGGVSTEVLSSKTMECTRQAGLYFIGEVTDVTGHLGGFNFQWAWASGHAAGQAV